MSRTPQPGRDLQSTRGEENEMSLLMFLLLSGSTAADGCQRTCVRHREQEKRGEIKRICGLIEDREYANAENPRCDLGVLIVAIAMWCVESGYWCSRFPSSLFSQVQERRQRWRPVRRLATPSISGSCTQGPVAECPAFPSWHRAIVYLDLNRHPLRHGGKEKEDRGEGTGIGTLVRAASVACVCYLQSSCSWPDLSANVLRCQRWPEEACLRVASLHLTALINYIDI